MTYELAIGDRTYSSWSLRGWLLFENFGLKVRCETARLYTDDFPALLARFKPATLVPAMRLPSGVVVAETLAIAETLADRHPSAGHWPDDRDLRAAARAVTSEMHAGFSALRAACPMNLAHAWAGFEPSDAVRADLDRIEALWRWCWDLSGTAPGGWLFGRYSVADAFFAPVAARIAGYGLSVSDDAQTYVDAHLSDPAFRRWRAMGWAEHYHQSFYDQPLEKREWPGPEPLAAIAAETGPSVNAECPYSGQPVTDFLLADGKVYGFCNPFCRDKTLADPLAWPGFVEIYQS